MENIKRGKKLKSGKGIFEMMDVCHANGWNDENTILVIDDYSDLCSKWTIYESIKK